MVEVAAESEVGERRREIVYWIVEATSERKTRKRGWEIIYSLVEVLAEGKLDERRKGVDCLVEKVAKLINNTE